MKVETTITSDEPDMLTRLREQQAGKCATCWARPATRLTRIIPINTENLARYGLLVLDHHLNSRAVCDDPRCAAFWDIGEKHYSEGLLVAEIRADLAARAERVRP